MSSLRTNLIRLASTLPLAESKPLLELIQKHAYTSPTRQIKEHPAFVRIHKKLVDRDTAVEAFLVEYSTNYEDYTGGFYVEVYDPNGDLMFNAEARRSENLKRHLEDGVSDWQEQFGY